MEAGDARLLAERAGITPDAWQQDILRSTARQTIMLVTRQGGKSTVTSIRALHRALYTPASLVLLLAPSYRQSKELFRKVKDALAALPYPSPLISSRRSRWNLTTVHASLLYQVKRKPSEGSAVSLCS